MRVFLSHASQDAEHAQRIAEHLERSGLQAFLSERDLLPGDNWGKKVGDALETSDAMVVLLSPDAARSSWVRREIEYALQSRSYEQRLIPVMVRHTEDVPWILRKLRWVDMEDDDERGLEEIVAALQEAEAA